MKNYILKFYVLPQDNTWISTYRNDTFIHTGDNALDACEMFFAHVETLGLFVDPHAAKNPRKMYRDNGHGPQQVGFIFNASVEIEINDRWVKRYADLCVEINEAATPQEFTA